MDEFTQTASSIISISTRIILLNKQKTEFAKSINYQIPQLFQLLGEASKQNEKITIDEHKLSVKLSERQLNIFYGKHSLNRTYLTPDDLCNYLHINKQNFKRMNSMYDLEETSLHELQTILQKQEKIEQELAQLFQSIQLERWFSEVDFFSNGYIDTSALYEYLLHYDQGKEPFEQYNALLILKDIKKYSNSDKVILQDIRNFIDPQDEILPILLTNDRFPDSINQPHPSMKNSALSSNFSLQNSTKLAPKIGKKETYAAKTTLTPDQIEEYLKQQYNMTFEERLIKLHARNQKYIKQAKRQMEGVIPICNVQIQSHLQVHYAKADSSDLIVKLQLLGDIYNKIVQQIQELIVSNPKFTFVNAYSLMDYDEQNKVNYNYWITFLKEFNFTITNKKINTFFQVYSSDGIIKFSDFLKVFKYLGAENEYVRCQGRYSLIYEGWSDVLINNYRTSLSKLIRIVQQRETLKKSIYQRRQQLSTLMARFTYPEEIMELLGQQYKYFILEFYKDGVVNIQILLGSK